MSRTRRILLVVCALLPSCQTSAFAELSALAAKPPLPYSILVTGGAFVRPGIDSVAELGVTYARSADPEVFELSRLVRLFRDARVFVAIERDAGAVDARQTLAALGADGESSGRSADRLAALCRRARRAGHDAVLVVESIHDGPIESRGINDRWPFTLGAWLFALGALIPDRTWESRASLQIAIRDVYTGRRIAARPWVAEPGSVDLNMFDRCGLWGFVQSILVPPFFTSVNEEKVTASVASLSIDRMLIAAVRQLKSRDVGVAFRQRGPAAIVVQRVADEWSIRVEADEPLSAIGLRVDGQAVAEPTASTFEAALLASRRVDAAGAFVYEARTRLTEGRRLQVLVQTEAARIRSFTYSMRSR